MDYLNPSLAYTAEWRGVNWDVNTGNENRKIRQKSNFESFFRG